MIQKSQVNTNYHEIYNRPEIILATSEKDLKTSVLENEATISLNDYGNLPRPET